MPQQSITIVVYLASVSTPLLSASPPAKTNFPLENGNLRSLRYFAKMEMLIHKCISIHTGINQLQKGGRGGKEEGINEGEGLHVGPRGPATTSCSHLARVMPATRWITLQVLPLRNPLLRAACACWSTTMPPTQPQRGAWTKQHEGRIRNVTRNRRRLKEQGARHRVRSGTRANRLEIDTHICRNGGVDWLSPARRWSHANFGSPILTGKCNCE